jgi:hypothetical protein
MHRKGEMTQVSRQLIHLGLTNGPAIPQLKYSRSAAIKTDEFSDRHAYLSSSVRVESF